MSPGSRLDASRATAGRFREKPSNEAARACFADGCLWNTFVFVAKVGTLLETGQQFLPDLTDRLARIAPFAGTEDEPWAAQQAYALAPTANFSRAILERGPPFLAVSRLPALTWSDWGTPERVLRSLREAGISPPWLEPVDRSASPPPNLLASAPSRLGRSFPLDGPSQTPPLGDDDVALGA